MALTNKDGGFMMLKLLLDLSSYVLQLFFLLVALPSIFIRL
jgi:hypothetical protein